MGTADRTLIYLTMHVVQCLVKCEKIEDKPSAVRELRAMSQKPFLSPGESGFALGGMFAAATSKGESGENSLCLLKNLLLFTLPFVSPSFSFLFCWYTSSGKRSLSCLISVIISLCYRSSSVVDLWKAYMKQARDELCIRLCDRLFDADGSKNKWWQVSDILLLFLNFLLLFVCVIILVFFKEEIYGKRT
jgi:hypothetical protein